MKPAPPSVPCGDWAPSGRYACNRPDGHDFDHSFSKLGVPVATWPRDASSYQREPVDVSTIAEGVGTTFLPGRVLGENRPDPVAELRQWWLDLAENEVDRTVPKAVEYGAADLRDIGLDLARCMGRTVTDEEATELGIYFYMRGKLSRWTDAVVRGDRVSDDTLFDLGVYVRMAQRTRSHGGWPGIDKEDAK